jgi:precorrin-3B synthase
MSARSELVVGWCPGALQPMQSGDGLIVRVRPRLSRLSLVQLETLARSAHRFGDGSLHLSNRANVQIRGVSPDAHGALLEILGGAGMTDSEAGIEAVRNIMVSPAVELSAHAGLAAGLAARLEDLLAKSEALQQLPGKFGIAVQAGNEIDTAAMSDVTFIVQGDEIAMVLEGAPDQAFLAGSTPAAAEAYERVAIAFLKFRRAQPAIRRMRDAIAHFGLEAVSKQTGLPFVAHGLPLEEAPALAGDLGDAFGMAFTFGDVGRDALLEITGLMRRECIAEAGLSPHRALVFPAHEQEKAALWDLAKRIDAITDPSDIRLRLHGCPGAPACWRATVASRQDAEAALRALAGIGFNGMIHISGCEKRCAYPREADITAIGADGAYTVTGPGGRILNRVLAADLPKAIAELARAA